MDSLPDFAASVAYLEDLTAKSILPWKQAELRRAAALLAAVGDPQQRFATIQVAGTAGKGSTTTMAAAMLRRAGYRTGAFTSPHLQSYRERIAIDGAPIDEETWVRALRILQPVIARMEHNDLPDYTLGRPAFLEVLWAMAALIFVERGVQCAVVETGVGGRLDPTTVNAATVAVITNVSLDHTERLGPTVEAIATEKAGLIKPRQIVVSAARGSALAVIRATCATQGAVLWRVDEEGPTANPESAANADSAESVALSAGGATGDVPFTIRTPLHTYTDLHVSLQGVHQRLNAACAVAAVDALAQQAHLTVDAQAVTAGLASAFIAGRMELIDGKPQILLDGAKGPAAAAALANALRTIYAGRRIVLVLAIVGDKDLETMTNLLSPLASAIVVTEPPWEKRAGFSGQIAAYARAFCAPVEQIPQIPAALKRAHQIAGPDDLIVVAGSLYLVGAVRDLLQISGNDARTP